MSKKSHGWKSELQFQSKLYQWFYNQHPHLRILQEDKKTMRCLLIHNYLNPKNKIDGAKLVGAGLCKGFPDMTLFVARGGYHAMMIELKLPGEKPKPEQREMFEALRAQGYHVIWTDDIDHAKLSITKYLNDETL